MCTSASLAPNLLLAVPAGNRNISVSPILQLLVVLPAWRDWEGLCSSPRSTSHSITSLQHRIHAASLTSHCSLSHRKRLKPMGVSLSLGTILLPSTTASFSQTANNSQRSRKCCLLVLFLPLLTGSAPDPTEMNGKNPTNRSET